VAILFDSAIGADWLQPRGGLGASDQNANVTWSSALDLVSLGFPETFFYAPIKVQKNSRIILELDNKHLANSVSIFLSSLPCQVL
jgi:hypothetical protein